MGNTSTHNDINESNESVSYYYTTNRNVDLIDANLNYDKLNEYIEHITTPFKIINDNVEKEKLNFAINNCIIEESSMNNNNANNISTSSNFSIEHGNVENDALPFDDFDMNTLLEDLDRHNNKINKDVELSDKDIDNDSEDYESLMYKPSKKPSKVGRMPKVKGKKRTMIHLSNQNVISKLALVKEKVKANIDDNDLLLKFQKNSDAVHKQTKVISLLGEDNSSSNRASRVNIKKTKSTKECRGGTIMEDGEDVKEIKEIKKQKEYKKQKTEKEIDNEKEKENNLEITNIENLSLYGTHIDSFANNLGFIPTTNTNTVNRKSVVENEIQEEFFSIAPSVAEKEEKKEEEEEKKKEEDAHNKNILEHLKEIITLDSENKFVFNKTNFDKVNTFSILPNIDEISKKFKIENIEENIPGKAETKTECDFFNKGENKAATMTNNVDTFNTNTTSPRKQRTFVKKFTSINYPKFKRENTNVIQAQIHNKIVQKMKIANFFFKNVLFYSDLKKVINITDRIIYANRFCVLTEGEFKCYKSKENFIVVQSPLLTIPLYSIKNINIINMNRKGVQKTKTIHFGIKFLKSEAHRDNLDEMDSSLMIDQSRDEDLDVEFFGSNEGALIKKWIHEINSWIKKNE